MQETWSSHAATAAAALHFVQKGASQSRCLCPIYFVYIITTAVALIYIVGSCQVFSLFLLRSFYGVVCFITLGAGNHPKAGYLSSTSLKFFFLTCQKDYNCQEFGAQIHIVLFVFKKTHLLYNFFTGNSRHLPCLFSCTFLKIKNGRELEDVSLTKDSMRLSWERRVVAAHISFITTTFFDAYYTHR